MKKLLFSLAFLVILVTAFPFSSAALTEGQIQSILNLLSSFGADTTTVINVENALRGKSTTPLNFSFERNLVLGDRNEDVRQLQITLNSLGVIVASQGGGSPGSETTFFGNKTKDAVERFQNKYREDVLVPHGLTQGNGYVGPSTRTKLNELLQKEESSDETIETSGVPHITSISPTSGIDGTEITITGTGFSDMGNIALIGFATFMDVPAIDGQIKITINSGIPEHLKKYQLPLDTVIIVRTNGVYSNEVPFTLTSSAPVISEETKNTYRDSILDQLDLPASFFLHL